jgi:hypothetical protein
MLDANLDVKIGDLGLCREMNDPHEYKIMNHQRRLPFRWLPLEVLLNGGPVCFYSECLKKHFSLRKNVMFGHLAFYCGN